ncbi:hypothetical protein AAK882_10495 [Carnobacteriaceae bacterium 52-44]
MKNEEINKNNPYPWKGFLVFLGIYLIALAAQYPMMLDQARAYIEIMGGSFTYTPNAFALLAIIQPLLLGVIAIYGGHRFFDRVNLRSLTNEVVEGSRTVETREKEYTLKDSMPFIVVFAVTLAILNLGFDVIFQNWLPEIYQPNFSIPNVKQILSNIFYSGIGQEILLRWGIMTTIIYVLSSRGRDLNQWVYIIGIVFTAILYGFAQYNSIASLTDFSFILVLRILLLNGLDGILFGWLYYKFHFEAAVLSHVLVNLLVILGNVLITSIF